MDLDSDGDDEIVLGGVNDLKHQAFLAVIEPDIPRSICEVPAGYAPSFATGKEVAYLLFPPSEAAQAIARSSRAVKLKRKEPDHLSVSIQLPVTGDADIPERVYVLDRNLQTTELHITDEYKSIHHQLRQERRQEHEYQAAEKVKLLYLECLSQAAQNKKARTPHGTEIVR